VVPWVPDATVFLSSSVAHVGVHDFSVDLVSPASAKEESLVQQFVAQDDVESSPLKSPFHVETDLLPDFKGLEHNDSLAIVTKVMDPYANGSMVLVVHEDTHISPIIQHNMELWRRIREYDEKAAEIPFTPVLSKKQKQQVKKNPL